MMTGEQESVDKLTSDVLFMIMLIFLGSTFFMNYQKSIPLPYTVVLFLYGIVIGRLALWVSPRVAETLGAIPSDLLFYIFLPVLIFEGSYAINIHALKRIFWHAAFLASVGIVVNTVLLALPSKLLLPEWSWFSVFLLGSLLSATDPVAVVTLLKNLGVEKRITALLDSESVMNDGTAIIAYTLLFPAAKLGHLSGSMWVTLLKCLELCVLPIIVGPLFGYIQYFWLRRTREELAQACITVSVTYISYYVSYFLMGTSGVLTVFFQGIFLSYYYPSLFPGRQGNLIYATWEFLVHLGNTVLFALIGVILVADVFPTLKPSDLTVIVCMYVVMLCARLLMLELLGLVLNALSSFKLDQRAMLLMVHAGLRGGVAATLALATKQGGLHDGVGILKISSGVVLLSLLINASSAEAVVRALGFNTKTEHQAIQMNYALNYLRDAKERALEYLKRDVKYQNANWLSVENFISRGLKNPYAHDIILSEEETLTVNRLLMSTFKASLWQQRDEKRISETVMVELGSIVASLIEKGELLDVCKLKMFCAPPQGTLSRLASAALPERWSRRARSRAHMRQEIVEMNNSKETIHSKREHFEQDTNCHIGSKNNSDSSNYNNNKYNKFSPMKETYVTEETVHKEESARYDDVPYNCVNNSNSRNDHNSNNHVNYEQLEHLQYEHHSLHPHRKRLHLFTQEEPVVEPLVADDDNNNLAKDNEAVSNNNNKNNDNIDINNSNKALSNLDVNGEEQNSTNLYKAVQQIKQELLSPQKAQTALSISRADEDKVDSKVKMTEKEMKDRKNTSQRDDERYLLLTSPVIDKTSEIGVQEPDSNAEVNEEDITNNSKTNASTINDNQTINTIERDSQWAKMHTSNSHSRVAFCDKGKNRYCEEGENEDENENEDEDNVDGYHDRNIGYNRHESHVIIRNDNDTDDDNSSSSNSSSSSYMKSINRRNADELVEALMQRLLPPWARLLEKFIFDTGYFKLAHRRAQENAFMVLLAIAKCLGEVSTFKYNYIESTSQARRVERWLDGQLELVNRTIYFFYENFPGATNNVASTRAVLSVAYGLTHALLELDKEHGFGARVHDILLREVDEMRKTIPHEWNSDLPSKESDLVMRAVASSNLGRTLRKAEIRAIGAMGLVRKFVKHDIITLPQNSFLIVVFGSIRALHNAWTTMSEYELVESFGDMVGVESFLLPDQLRKDQQRQWRVLTPSATTLIISFNSINPFLTERSLRSVKALWRAAAVEVILPFLQDMITLPRMDAHHARERLNNIVSAGTPLIGPRDCVEFDWTTQFHLCFYLRGSDESGLFGPHTPPCYISTLFVHRLSWVDSDVVLYAVPMQISDGGYIPWLPEMFANEEEYYNNNNNNNNKNNNNNNTNSNTQNQSRERRTWRSNAHYIYSSSSNNNSSANRRSNSIGNKNKFLRRSSCHENNKINSMNSSNIQVEQSEHEVELENSPRILRAAALSILNFVLRGKIPPTIHQETSQQNISPTSNIFEEEEEEELEEELEEEEQHESKKQQLEESRQFCCNHYESPLQQSVHSNVAEHDTMTSASTRQLLSQQGSFASQQSANAFDMSHTSHPEVAIKHCIITSASQNKADKNNNKIIHTTVPPLSQPLLTAKVNTTYNYSSHYIYTDNNNSNNNNNNDNISKNNIDNINSVQSPVFVSHIGHRRRCCRCLSGRPSLVHDGGISNMSSSNNNNNNTNSNNLHTLPPTVDSPRLTYNDQTVCILQDVNEFVTPVPYVNQLFTHYAAMLEQLCVAALRFLKYPDDSLHVRHAERIAEITMEFLLGFCLEMSLLKRGVLSLLSQLGNQSSATLKSNNNNSSDHNESNNSSSITSHKLTTQTEDIQEEAQYVEQKEVQHQEYAKEHKLHERATWEEALQALSHEDEYDEVFECKVCAWDRNVNLTRKYHLRTIIMEMNSYANKRFPAFVRSIRAMAHIVPELANAESVEGLHAILMETTHH